MTIFCIERIRHRRGVMDNDHIHVSQFRGYLIIYVRVSALRQLTDHENIFLLRGFYIKSQISKKFKHSFIY